MIIINSDKSLKILSSVVAVLALIVSSVGFFFKDNGTAFYVNNIYGNSVKLYGNGLYAYDTYFKAPIQRGTDLVTLFIAIPLLIGITFFWKKKSIKRNLLLAGVLSDFLYYSASLAFGVSYNRLFPVYILLFSSSFFAFILSIKNIEINSFRDKILENMPRRGIAVFMIFAGLSVFVWLIEIVGAVLSGKPPIGLGTYTTEPTYVIDLGIIAPSAFTCAFLLIRNNTLGYVFAEILLVLNSFIGIIVVAQTLVQKSVGVNISIGEMIAYVGVFVVMSSIAILLNIKLLKGISK